MASTKGKRIGLMTWFTYHNYGTALQVTSLCRVMRDLGGEVDVIDYKPKGIRQDGRPINPTARGLSSKAFRKLYEHFRPGPVYNPEVREQRFIDFLGDNLTLTSPCPTMAELEGLNNTYDTFVCGSDQIWSPPNFDPHYYLDFAGDDRLKVAYAPSVGLPNVDDPDIARNMAQLCRRLDALSTREESGSQIVSRLTGREVTTVVDPTLLLDANDWAQITSDSAIRVDEPYMLVYMLGSDERHWRRAYTLAARLDLPLRAIPVFERDLLREGCIKEPIGPREFVSLVKNASYVCTDSFHGIVFSANLGVDFCAFERFKNGEAANQNSRIYNILNKLGLSERIAVEGVTDEALMRPIDWEHSRSLLVQERERSLEWLTDALELRLKVSEHKDNIECDRSLCCGCTACEVACPVDAISVSLDEEGFWRARVNEDTCVSCGRCRKVCPFIEHSSSVPIVEGSLFSYKFSDISQLLSSSSGGAGAAIADAASSDGAAVLGCAFERSEGAVARLVKPGDTEGLASLAGSKYMQCRIGNALAEAYAHQGPLLVTGTPCQVAAARNMLGSREDVTYIDLICHGVPTRLLYSRYIEWLHDGYDIDQKNAETIFRYKLRGWRERYIYTADGSHEVCLHQRKDPYFLMYEAGQCYAGCCYECPWRSKSAADVRLGDYWGPRFKNDRSGVSMLLALTERGFEVVQDLADSGEVLKQPLEDYMLYQQIENIQKPIFRDEVLKKLAQPDLDIMVVCEEFAEPVARRRDVWQKVEPIWNLTKRMLGKG